MEKTLRMNLLYDFYSPLLTERQRDVFRMYFQEDLSLGEIGEQLAVSRQAIYDLLKRAEAIMEDFEAKLHLVTRHEQRRQLYAEILSCLESMHSTGNCCGERIAEIKEKIRQSEGGMD